MEYVWGCREEGMRRGIVKAPAATERPNNKRERKKGDRVPEGEKERGRKREQERERKEEMKIDEKHA